MRIGVVKEIKPDEYRVALTPAGARSSPSAGTRCSSRRAPASAAGSRTTPTPPSARDRARVDDVWARADLLLKVKEPIAPEYGRLREGQILFTYLHFAADQPLTRALLDSGITAIAYETVETDDGAPAAARADERGRRPDAPQAGAKFLERPFGGRGLLLGGVPASRRARSSSSAAASSATTPP